MIYKDNNTNRSCGYVNNRGIFNITTINITTYTKITMWKKTHLNRCLSTLIHIIEPGSPEPPCYPHDIDTFHARIPQVIHMMTTAASARSGNEGTRRRLIVVSRPIRTLFPHRSGTPKVDNCGYIVYSVRNIFPERGLQATGFVDKMWITPGLSTLRPPISA